MSEPQRKRVLGSSRITTFFDEDQRKTIVITVLFWSDGSVTWIPEER